ncbi:serine/threonine protein kinase [Streptomyces sp. NPDC089919]|uniref:serine/threonine protein kinase n=1 Tax=Streptomyces sp. NPDC089919 TaxID=3155188 RepID=UPI00343165E2
MEEYAGRVLADRYRLPLPPSDAYELVETRAFDTHSGQEVLVRQVPLPEVVDAELLEADGRAVPPAPRGATRRPADPGVRRAIEAAQAAARIPDHPRLDQVFDVFAEGGSLWIVSELVVARPLAALIADRPMNPYRAAEVASDVLTALRVLHAHGWTHRNITVRTVLVCEDGRVVLTGLAAGAAEEALCGYDPVPPADPSPAPPPEPAGAPPAARGPRPAGAPGRAAALPPGRTPVQPGRGSAPGASYDPGTGAWPAQGSPAADSAPGGGDTGVLPGAWPEQVPAQGPGAAESGRGGGDTGVLPGSWPDQGSGDAHAGRDGAGGLPEARPGPGSGRAGGPPGAGQGPGAGPAGAPGQVPGQAAAAQAPTVAPGYATPGGADLKATARAGAIAAYRAGTQAAATRRIAAPEPPRPQGSNLPQGYSYPYGGGPDDRPAAPAPWHGATPRSLPPGPAAQPSPDGAGPAGGVAPATAGEAGRGPERAGLPALPARPALPQGYAPAAGPPGSGAAGPGRGEARPGPYDAPGGAPRTDRGPGAGPANGHGTGDGQRAGRPAGVPGQGRAAGHAEAPGHGEAPAQATAGGTARPAPAAVTPLAAERARQTRINVVGAVTERWAPEQAVAVHENWQLAAPVGPATDLWALGALLYRAVQGHAPYPEDSAAELVELVCSEPPAFAEECGPLRPVVESLLRQDPTERPDFEELRGWLRSLVRSAPEPDAGVRAVPLPAPDATKLPIVRRRGELVRRRRAAREAAAAQHGRHRQAPPPKSPRAPKERRPPKEPRTREPREAKAPRPARPAAAPRRPARSLGRTLLLAVLLVMAGFVGYALVFMPKSEPTAKDVGPAATPQQAPASSAPPARPSPAPSPKQSGSGTQPQTTAPATPADPGAGYTVSKDTEGFEVAVPKGWQRRPLNDSGQVRYSDGDYELIVVPGRDPAAGAGDPLGYQRDKERELEPVRSSSWGSQTGVREITVGSRKMAEGQYSWTDGSGRSVYARNRVYVSGGRYHVLLVIGPDSGRDKVTEIYERATASYRVTR